MFINLREKVHLLKYSIITEYGLYKYEYNLSKIYTVNNEGFTSFQCHAKVAFSLNVVHI